MCYRASADPMSSWGCTSTDDGLSRTIVFFPHLLCPTDDLVVHKHNGVQLHHAETYFMYWSNANISCYLECCTNFRTNRFESRLMNRGICQDKKTPKFATNGQCVLVKFTFNTNITIRMVFQKEWFQTLPVLVFQKKDHISYNACSKNFAKQYKEHELKFYQHSRIY